jgi:hypothetical protein
MDDLAVDQGRQRTGRLQGATSAGRLIDDLGRQHEQVGPGADAQVSLVIHAE